MLSGIVVNQGRKRASRARADRNLGQRVALAGRIRADERLEYARAGARAQRDANLGIDRMRRERARAMHDLDPLGELNALRHGRG